MIPTDCSIVGTVWGGRELTMDAIRVTYDLLYYTLGPSLLFQQITLAHAPPFSVGAIHWDTVVSTRFHRLHIALPSYSS